MSHFSNRLEDFEPVELPESLPPDYSTYDLFANLLRKMGRSGQKTAQSIDLMRDELGSAYDSLRESAEEARLKANRLESEMENIESGLLDFMDIIDNLQRAAETIEDRAFIDAANVALKAKDQILTRLGIQVLPGEGSTFDSEIHFAVEAEAVDQPGLDNAVLRVVENGYRRGNRLLRRSSVVCGKFKGE